MSTTRIKICGLMEPQDIETINKYRPDYAGFIINFPKSHRSRTPEQVAGLTASLIPDIVPVGVFVDQPEELVIDLLNRNVISIAQLHGHEDESYIRHIQDATGKPVFKAFVVRSPEDVKMAMSSPADEILLDAGLGGGTSFDWSILEPCALGTSGINPSASGTTATAKPSSPGTSASDSRRFILAGGLSSDNIKTAISTVHPWGVDISSGVETDKRKDPAKIAEIIGIIRDHI